MFSPPSAFKVYDKISEKNRYIPRQWTQKEFEAALPCRFNGRSKSISGKENDNQFKGNDGEESDMNIEKDELLSSSENIASTVSQYPRKISQIYEKINNLEEAGQHKSYYDEYMNTNSVNELENSKNSEARVKLNNNQIRAKDAIETCKGSECEATTKPNNAFISFLDACLQCLFNIDTFRDKVLHTSSSQTYSSFSSKLKYLLEVVSQADKQNTRNLWQLYSQDAFSSFYDNISTQSKSCDEALAFLLESLVEEIDNFGHENNLRSVIQGKFCHARICDQCETVVREYESFMFLNPSSPPTITTTHINVNILSCADGVWRITSLSLSSAGLVIDLKEELLKHLAEPSESSSIEIGEVKDSCLKEVFDDTKDLRDIRLEPTSSLFAFRVINCQSEVTKNSQERCTEVAKSNGLVDMSYHLYFSCGLCLDNGKEGGLLVHRSCGGMVCKDCLDEISRSNQDWELCPCPVCERPINLAKEMCPVKIGAETDQMISVTCAVMFRTNGSNKEHPELFGSPLLLSLPQKTAGYHLYRGIGCLLPNNLPMKEKTSFTLHNVDKSGLHCASCSSPNCTGCLVRINDTINIQPHTHLVVHFDGLTEKSKEVFGITNSCTPSISKTQVLFDDILRSCASSSTEGLCPKCLHDMTKTISSISNFPELLIINLNRQFARQGLPRNVPIADIARFVTVERENLSNREAGQGLTYQLRAAVLKEESSVYPTYKSYVSGRQAPDWLVHNDELEASERDPNFLYLTCDGVLFYEPVLHQTEPSRSQQTTAESEDTTNYPIWPVDVGFPSLRHVKGLDMTVQDNTIHSRQKKRSDYKNSDEIPNNHHRKPWDREPGECLLGNDIQLDQETRRIQESDEAYGSHLSLGEVKSSVHSKRLAANVLDGIDTISPISTTADILPEQRLLRETKKLINAVKTEDAYGIVCSLKRGGDPCLLVNDVTALHLVAGIKSDQRRSMLAYLLRYSNDVNIVTADGTTPMHVAAAWGHQDVVEILLRHGGDAFERTDIEGNSAFDLAVNDCSTFLQSVYNDENSTRFLGFPVFRKPTSSNPPAYDDDFKEKRLEDIVRSNVTLPSFVEDNGNSQIRRRWLQRLRSFRERSTGILRNLRKMGGRRRRSRIGVMVTEISTNGLEDRN